MRSQIFRLFSLSGLGTILLTFLYNQSAKEYASVRIVHKVLILFLCYSKYKSCVLYKRIEWTYV